MAHIDVSATGLVRGHTPLSSTTWPRSSDVWRLLDLPDMISLARRSASATVILLFATSRRVVYRFCELHRARHIRVLLCDMARFVTQLLGAA